MASREEAPAPSITWFVDRSLGRSVATALRGAGEHVVHHDEVFPQDTLDEVWLPHVGGQGWVLLTKDKLIRHHKLERDALIIARVRAFFLSSGKLSGEDQAARFVKALPSMKALVVSTPPPFMAIVGSKRAALIDERRSRKRPR